MPYFDDPIRKLESKSDADRLQVAFAPLLHAVLHHVGHHSDEHIQRVELVPAAGTQGCVKDPSRSRERGL